MQIFAECKMSLYLQKIISKSIKMKKIFTVIAIALFTIAANAQETKPAAKKEKAKKECCTKKATEKKACCTKK